MLTTTEEIIAQRVVDEVIKQLMDLQPNTEARVKATIQGIVTEELQDRPRPRKKKSAKKKADPDDDRPKFKCGRCTFPTVNPDKVCDFCKEIARRPKKCPRCSGPMEIRTGYLGDFWGCVRFPACNGTITARGTYMRKFSNNSPGDEGVADERED